MTLWDSFSEHLISRELKAISDRLDRHPRIREWVSGDLRKPGTKETGRNGLPVDSIIRAAIVKQMMSFSYQQLAFFIEDSLSIRSFTRITVATGKSALQNCISKIRAETWEKINRALIRGADHDGIEKGRVTRTDSTVMESNIHKPTDSSLLYDGIRIITNILNKYSEKGLVFPFADHTRSAKKLARKLTFMKKGGNRDMAYRKLLKIGRKVRDYLVAAIDLHQDSGSWVSSALQNRKLMDRVIDQTQRRVFHGEAVPAREKVVSFFETHTDIIKKGNREVQYGHKLNLTTGRTGLVIDMFIEDGNPCDSKTTVRMVKRQKEIYGRPPRQVSFDGGYASKGNLQDSKDVGVKDVAFHKKKSLKQEDMTSSNWIYRKLINFRAGVEGNISALKRRYGWYRCSWKGLDRFKAYAWLSTVAYNLVTLARHNTT